jgi:DNA repair exonuclease SbcCD ATPase subunit
MFKKIGIAALLAVAGLFVMNKAGLSSYGATAVQNLRSCFKKSVPVEFEIERLRYEISQLVPDMRKHVGAIAEEIVTVQNLKEEVADAKENLKRRKSEIVMMTKDLDRGAVTVVYDNREFPASRIREKLSRDFASYQRFETEVKSKEALLDAKERALEAGRQQLSEIRTQKQELEVELARLEADLKTVRLAQTHNKFHFDDSAIAHCKGMLAEIRNRLKVEKTTAELDGQFANDNTVPVGKKAKSASELTKEINAYFNEGPSTDGKVAERNSSN